MIDSEDGIRYAVSEASLYIRLYGNVRVRKHIDGSYTIGRPGFSWGGSSLGWWTLAEAAAIVSEARATVKEEGKRGKAV